MVRVVVADDQAIMREGIRYIIERDEEIKVVGCARDGQEALMNCKQHKPDVVLMDIVMPGSDGIEGVRLIKENYNDIKVIMLTTFNDDESIVRALNNGADGYMLKDISSGELIMAVKSAAMGISVMHRNTFSNIAKQINGGSGISIISEKKADFNLSSKEKEIIRLIVDGKDNKEIGLMMYMSVGSVKNTISGILKTLGLKDRTQLAVFAVKNDIV